MNRLIQFIKRFCYYGYHGAKFTREYDALGIHDLINAHIIKVDNFMRSDYTHLVWNDKSSNKGMKQLAELRELSTRLKDDSMLGYNLNALYDVYSPLGRLNRTSDEEIDRLFKIARLKDQMIRNGLEDRYWYLLRYRAPGFWD